MSDRTYIIGLLIGACVMLAVGITFTWLELRGYLAEDLPARSPTPTERTEPSDPAEPAEPTDDGGASENESSAIPARLMRPDIFRA